jgi:AraC family transcriptional regulator
MRIPQGQPIAGRASGFEKYGSTGVLASSTDRGWSGLSAELRCHSSGLIAWKSTPDPEICIDIFGNGSVITRSGGGVFDRTVAERGTIWLSPPGLQGDYIDISDPVPGILHVYLSSSHFSQSSLGIDLDTTGIASLRYQSSFQDPLLAEIAYAIAAELQVETSGGRLLAETLASSLAARLMQNHFVGSAVRAIPRITREGLDRRRLSRLMDYISANLEGDLTIDRLASIACLSRFHFARAFKAAVGLSPHRYVSAKRLEHAKVLLTRSDRSLVEIALALNFSCQANFTRAFRQVTGQTPSQYRKKFQP